MRTGLARGRLLCALLLVVFVEGGCSRPFFLAAWPPLATQGRPAEAIVHEIPLDGPLASRRAEISSLARYGDQVVLLPQYPARFGDNLFVLSAGDIAASLRASAPAPLTPQPLAFDDGGLASSIAYFQGFEAIAFAGDRAYLTIEAGVYRSTQGYIVMGHLAPDGSRLSLDPATLQPLPAQAALNNRGDEALTILPDGRVLTLYEANGANVNPRPVAHLFTPDLQPLAPAPMTTLEYRITDATPADATGAFWVLNQFSWYDAEGLQPGADGVAAKYGEGRSHAFSRTVERLVQLQVTPEGVTLAPQPPLQLALIGDFVPRNWEGIAPFARDEFAGFLLATDSFPRTMLVFVSGQ